MKLIKIVVSVAMVATLSASPVHAAAGGGGSCSGQGVAVFFGFQPWDACLTHDKNGAPIITSLSDVWTIALVVVSTILKLTGYIAVGFIVWGGVKYLKSQGEPGEVSQARLIIYNALLGLIICILSVAIIQYIAGTF